MIELFVVRLIPICCVNSMWRYLPEKKDQDKNNQINDIIEQKHSYLEENKIQKRT